MKLYVISEKQIEDLEILVWGSKMSTADEPGRFDKMIKLIRSQRINTDNVRELMKEPHHKWEH